ncbi:MAG: phosphate/phosphite/phosphonate ABC transporter substrate-binding protein [Desulfobacterales bacterium]|nr:phosphate/phosphite/phosphonate ABC transporter substrate-binding protein [Desulfobacterales bacterium]
MEKLRTLAILLIAAFAGTNAINAVSVNAEEVKIAVTAAFVSEKGLSVYEELASYLSKKTGWNVKLVSGLSYSEADEMIETGVVPVGFVCGFPYIIKAEKKLVELVAIPVMNLKSNAFPDAPGYENVPGKYYSYTIVRKGSTIRNWTDMKGKTYAFNDTASNSGYNMPRSKLISMGKDWKYFSKVIKSGSHEESIRMVADGIVDASSVDSLVLDYDRSIDDESALGVEIIEALGPAGAPPVVISTKSNPSLKPKLIEALTGMHNDPAGRKVLGKALLLRFDPPDDTNYDDIREMFNMAKQKGFKDFD